jgi:hypothetical protein
MGEQLMSQKIRTRVEKAARQLRVSSPMPFVGRLLDASFSFPEGDAKYAANTLTPGAVPFEPSFSEREPEVLRFTIEPYPGALPTSRRDEATREMRRLVGPLFGRDALHWFDERSEEWRGLGANGGLDYGAWFGTSYDGNGLSSSKVYYELKPHQLAGLPPSLLALVRTAMATMPNLMPVFTTIACRRDAGSQRVTFLHNGPLRLTDLTALMSRTGMEHQLPSLMQIVGLTLGGRFDLPERSVLIGLSETSEGPELKLEVMLGMLPDLPPSFLDLLALGLTERPRELRALSAWLQAFTPESQDWPGNFSVLSIRTTARMPARVALYLRPVEFEIHRRLSDVKHLNPASSMFAPAA